MNLRILSSRFVMLGCLFLAVGIGFGESPDAQPAPSERFRIAISDGSELNAQLRVRTLHFQTSMGAMSIEVINIASFQDGKLTLTDGTDLKGRFSEGQLPVQLSTGPLDLAMDKIVAITVWRAPSVAPAAPTPEMGQPQLVGRVLDNFGQSLDSVSVQIANTQFATTTDSHGNYTLGYAPGQITVTFDKAGYRGTSLQFSLSQPSRVPVRDVILLKQLPGKLCLLSDHDYIVGRPAQVRTTSKNLNGNMFGGGASMATIYSISGLPIQIKGGAVRIMLDHAGLAQSVHPEIYRIGANGVFVQETMMGLGGSFKYAGQRENIQTQPGYGDVQVYSARLPSGEYALVTCENAEDAFAMGGMSGSRYIFGGPAFVLDIDASAETVANSSGGAARILDPKVLQDFTQALKDEITRKDKPPTQADSEYTCKRSGLLHSTHFTMHYPTDFKLDEGKGAVIARFTAPHKAPDGDFAPNILIVYSAANSEENLRDFATKTCDNIRHAFPGGKCSDLVETQLAGNQAYILVMEGMGTGGASKQAHVVALLGRAELSVNLYATPATFDEYWADFKRVWDSLQVH